MMIEIPDQSLMPMVKQVQVAGGACMQVALVLYRHAIIIVNGASYRTSYSYICLLVCAVL